MWVGSRPGWEIGAEWLKYKVKDPDGLTYKEEVHKAQVSLRPCLLHTTVTWVISSPWQCLSSLLTIWWRSLQGRSESDSQTNALTWNEDRTRFSNGSSSTLSFPSNRSTNPNPMPRFRCGEHTIKWTSSFKYLGYWLTTKLGWGNVIGKMKLRIRQQTALVNSIKFGGASSSVLRRILFSTFVLPFFTWLFALHPLFTDIQQSNLNHFYHTSLKRVYHCLHWEDFFFGSAFGERPLDDLCYSYWEKYCKALSKSLDGRLLLEQSSINAFRSNWELQEYRISCLR